MKSKTKKKQSIWDYKVQFVVDPKLNALKGENFAPEKLAQANAHLKKMKSLPK
jgi:hypothetical protein